MAKANISVSQNQCLAKTASRCVLGSITATHDFEVTNFSLLEGMGFGKFVSSSSFDIGGREWVMKLYPDGFSRAQRNHISAFLCLLNGPVSVRVKYSFSLLCKGNEEAEVLMKDFAHVFDCLSSWGWPEFMEKSTLKKFLQLNDDSFTLRCVATIIKDPVTEEIITVTVPDSNLPQHFERLLKDGKGTDVTFTVDGQMFHAHRCVLAARSCVFEAELFGPMKEPKQYIKIEDMEPSVFEALLHFIYTDSLPANCEASATIMQHLLVAADRYGLDRLKLMCEARLCHSIDVRTVATTLALAEQHHCVQLKNACLGFFDSPSMLLAVMKTDGYKHLAASCQLVVQEILAKVAAFHC